MARRRQQQSSSTARVPDDVDEPHGVTVHLDEVLAERGMTLTELAERVGVTVVNLSVLKNGRAKAVRFSTLTGICRALDCQPGDILRVD
jgi:putative transcriptional regulator